MSLLFVLIILALLVLSIGLAHIYLSRPETFDYDRRRKPVSRDEQRKAMWQVIGMALFGGLAAAVVITILLRSSQMR